MTASWRGGPARLASLLGLDRDPNGVDLTEPDSPVRSARARRCGRSGSWSGPRVGVAAAHDLPWRFWIDDPGGELLPRITACWRPNLTG